MLLSIARFEYRYLLRNPLLWLTFAATFGLQVIGMSVKGFELGNEGGLLVNAGYATARNYLVLSVLYMFVTTAFVANAVIRDDETGFGPIVRSTRITKLDYVLGRFLGAFAIAATCMLALPLGMLVGTQVPWADPSVIGPNRPDFHLYAYFLLALPNLFISAAILFALATMTRSMMGTYLGVVGFVAGFFILASAFGDRPDLGTVVALLDPFGGRALSDAVRYWTVAQRNVGLPDFTGALLHNRLLWVGIGVGFLALAYTFFRFAEQGMSRRERKNRKLAEAGSTEASVHRLPTTLPAPRHDGAARRALLRMRTRFEMRQVFLSPAFPVLMAWGMLTTLISLTTQRDPDGRPTYPTTLSLIPEIAEGFFAVPLIVAIYYAGELVWRERDRRIHELVDASPMPAWAYVVPKTIAMGLVLVSMLLTTVVAAVVTQLSLGFTELELGKYLLWHVLPTAWDLVLLTILAVFVQALSPHKAVGWGVMLVFMFWQEFDKTIDHNLVLYGGTPAMPLSDLNGAGSFWVGPWVFRLYWGAFGIILLVAAHLLWRRGVDVRLRPRLARARRSLRGAPGLVAGGAFAMFVGTGTFAYWNTNVLNGYRTPAAIVEDAVDLEKTYGKHRDAAQPVISGIVLDVALYPDERRAETKGTYRLRNAHAEPIPEIHVRVPDRDLELRELSIEGGRLVHDDTRHRWRTYRLDRPMAPGEVRTLSFATRRWVRGFRNGQPEKRLVENGTFLAEFQLGPMVGVEMLEQIEDPALRREHGLPELTGPAALEDSAAAWKPGNGREWAKVEVTVSTSADQVPLAPGNKVSDEVRDGRRIARFVSGAPIRPRFTVLSARYAEKHRTYRGIDLAVYHHPAHGWNVDRMLDAMEKSLDYYQANFGPYQFDHFRVVEFPGYFNFAQAFAGTIPFSETVGFIADYTQPNTMDQVTGMVSHELAHQWWAHQVVGAEGEGQGVLSETLAQYAAHMIVKRYSGADQIRRYLRFELDWYLAARSEQDPPLARATGQHHLLYRKGALAMYLLQERLGEEAVNRALRSLVTKFRFKDAPYARTTDLIAALRAEARTPEDQQLITDLFERVTLYDLKVSTPTAARRADGRWEVTVPVEAAKRYVDGKGGEAEAALDERIEVGLFMAEPGFDAFDSTKVVLMERRRIRSGRQVLTFVTDRKPTFAGIDPYNFHIDRNSADNVLPVE